VAPSVADGVLARVEGEREIADAHLVSREQRGEKPCPQRGRQQGEKSGEAFRFGSREAARADRFDPLRGHRVLVLGHVTSSIRTAVRIDVEGT
jgi:hypothetical protein